eukprot:CAMPEP_0197004598 /NCGR_PEP_ID=MMETSP1380-20130617/23848_1 /TAXON_ID=5936 /ORGANISM="Euplotes crassus, Strain CT5" /LENGTH=207 /DNA_ID=CAMNT_0042423443 /DNA_START=44 /DNA_END=667 /DNA_ORIENTATION=-
MKDATAKFTDPICVEISFEALQELKQLIWKVIYIGEANNDESDQVLEDIEMPIEQVGSMRFTIEAPGPDPTKIRAEELVGVTAILITCSYNGNEFFRVGYYVNVLYGTDELNENPPNPPLIDELGRLVMVDQPRVTNFPIEWDEAAGSSTLGIVPPDQIENFNPTTGFGYTDGDKDARDKMYAQDRKEMLSSANLQSAAEALQPSFQ